MAISIFSADRMIGVSYTVSNHLIVNTGLCVQRAFSTGEIRFT